MSRLEAGSAASVPGPADARARERRRAVLAVLEGAAAPLALADLAAELVEREQASPGAADHEAIQRCYVSLYHRHVPKLVDAGLVSFDDDRRTVALRG